MFITGKVSPDVGQVRKFRIAAVMSRCVKKNLKLLAPSSTFNFNSTSELTEDEERDALALPGARHVARHAAVVALVAAAQSDDAQVAARVDSDSLGRRLTHNSSH